MTCKDREKIRNRAEELFSLVNIPEKTWRKTSAQISGGEAQRAGIVRAVINHPNVLFADEPTGALNSANSAAVLDGFTSLHENGQSIVMVTHDKKSALRGNRIIYIRDGKIFGECDLGKFEPDGSLTAFVCEDFSKVTNDICYEGSSPAKENEIAVGNAIADDYPIGTEIEITAGSRSEDYTVTGYIQSVNNAGMVCQLTGKGYEKIGEKPDSVNVYLSDKNADGFIKEYEENYGTVVKSSVNFEQMSENGQRMYMGIVSVIVVILFVISVLMVLLVMYVIINSMISRRRQEYGIYKAIGYTNRQLTLKTVFEFIPVVAVASVISAIAGLWYLPVIDKVMFSMIGAVKNQFEVSVWILIVFAVLFTDVAFGISVLLSAPIKKITAYSLLRD